MNVPQLNEEETGGIEEVESTQIKKLSVCLSVCLLFSRITQKYWTDFHQRMWYGPGKEPHYILVQIRGWSQDCYFHWF